MTTRRRTIWSGAIPAALALATILVGGAMTARAANENLLEGLPPELKQLYEGSTDNLQPSAYDNSSMSSTVVFFVEVGSSARRRLQTPGNRRPSSYADSALRRSKRPSESGRTDRTCAPSANAEANFPAVDATPVDRFLY